MKLYLLAPVPPPYGGVANWEQIVENKIINDSNIELKVINIAPNKRPTDGRTLLDRVLNGVWVMMKSYLQLKKYIKKDIPDAVHITSSGGLGFFRDILFLKFLKKKNINTVFHIHFGRSVQYRKDNKKQWKQLKKAVSLANNVITIDQKTYQLLLHTSINKNVYCINNPIDISSFEDYEISYEKRITYIGWVLKEKGIEELLEAFNLFKRYDKEEYILEIIGPINDDYEKYLKSNFALDNVIFYGELSHKEAMKALSKTGIFILPSYTEGFPNVILEAMVLKKPIIATNVGEIPNMIADGAGIVINPKSVEDIRDALIDFIQNKEMRINCTQKAYEKVIREYDIQITYQKYKSLWMKSIKNKCW